MSKGLWQSSTKLPKPRKTDVAYNEGYKRGYDECKQDMAELAALDATDDTKRLDYVMRHPLDSHRLMSRAAIDAAIGRET